MSRAHGRPLKFFKVFLFIFLIIILKSLVVLDKIMPIANVNRIVFVRKLTIRQPICTIRQPFCTIRQPIAVWHIVFHNSYKFGRFLLGWDITDWNRMTDSAVVFRKPITTGEHPLE